MQERTHSQVSYEEVGDSAQRPETVNDVDDQRITQNPQHYDGAVGQDQYHLKTTKQEPEHRSVLQGHHFVLFFISLFLPIVSFLSFL